MTLRNTRLILFFVLAMLITAGPAIAQQVVFVDRDRPPGGDGTSWQSAYRFLQDALAGQNPLSGPVATDFWIADGTYRPDQGVGLTLGDRSLSFELDDGVTLLGGFNGTETMESQRDPDVNIVIFSGDLSSNDGPNFTNYGDNSFHIVTTCNGCSGAAVVDGVTIQGGNGDGGLTARGGGVLAAGALQLSVIDCILQANTAQNGGAIAAVNAPVVISDSTISGNRGVNKAGGLWAAGTSAVTVTDTVFSGNNSLVGDVVAEFGSRIFADDSNLETVFNLGTVGAGDDGTAGSFVTSGSFTQDNSIVAGITNFDLGGTSPGVTHDRIDILSNASLRGTANLQLTGNYMPGGAERFAVLEAVAITDPFDLALFPLLDNGLTLDLTHTVTQTVEAEPVNLSTIMDFDQPVGFPINGEATDVAIGEFDENTFNEAAVTVPDPSDGVPGNVVVLVNDGINGDVWQGFGTDVTVQVGVSPVALAIGDLDGDFVDDIVVANYADDTVSVLINRRNLLGADPFTRTDYPTGGGGPLDVALGDIDLMNGLDIIIANESGEVTVLTNFGDGTFDIAAVLDEPGSPGTVDPTDIDNDKDIDIIITDVEASSVLVAVNVGDNTFEFTQEFPLGATPVVANAIDLNGDAQDDITALVPDLGVLVMVFNEGGGNFSPVITVPLGPDVQSMTAADMDGDGDTDLAVVMRNESGNRVVQVLRNDSTPLQAAYTVAEQLGLEESPTAVVAGDLDDDAVADLVSPAAPGSPLASGPGSGLVSSHVSEPFVPCAADNNADGTVDVSDLLALLAAWGSCPGACPPDTNGDGTVDVSDLLALLAAWGDCP